ncbi:acyltransferase family protein [Methylobacterium sp. ID0610]|uniref:acyltransferase family protein n=1 Tax=Methylobacterium carpenticola TaxID=3344827 RepID=UPI0036AE13E3
MTLGEELDAANGNPSGFNYTRLFLALAVVAWHTVIVCYGLKAEEPFWNGPMRPAIFAILPAFFALGGFLVASSAFRNTIPGFLALRAIRLYPALIFEVVTFSIIIGPFITTCSPGEYFSDGELYLYLLNTTGYIHYYLPGVFSNNPAGPAVNLQLWTIPREFECYALLTGLSLIGFTRRPILIALALFLMSLCAMMRDQHALIGSGPPARLLILSFLAGILLYTWKDRITNHVICFVIAVALSWFLLRDPRLMSLSPFPIAYATVWLGLKNPRKTWLVASGDYSYGLYLYGYPTQQLVAHLLPDLRIWYWNGLISLVVAFTLAYVSWHVIEEPILKRKRHILALLRATPDQRRRAMIPLAVPEPA